MLGGGDGQQQQLIRSDRAKSGYKGVQPTLHGRYQAICQTARCRGNHLGNFGTPEDAAQSYLQHYQKKHPEELKQERAPRPVLPEVQVRLLIRSDRAKSLTVRTGDAPAVATSHLTARTPSAAVVLGLACALGWAVLEGAVRARAVCRFHH